MFVTQMSDRGGGIPRSLTDQLFHYMYSTAPQPSKSDAHTVPLAGTVLLKLIILEVKYYIKQCKL